MIESSHAKGQFGHITIGFFEYFHIRTFNIERFFGQTKSEHGPIYEIRFVEGKFGQLLASFNAIGVGFIERFLKIRNRYTALKKDKTSIF